MKRLYENNLTKIKKEFNKKIRKEMNPYIAGLILIAGLMVANIIPAKFFFLSYIVLGFDIGELSRKIKCKKVESDKKIIELKGDLFRNGVRTNNIKLLKSKVISQKKEKTPRENVCVVIDGRAVPTKNEVVTKIIAFNDINNEIHYLKEIREKCVAKNQEYKESRLYLLEKDDIEEPQGKQLKKIK